MTLPTFVDIGPGRAGSSWLHEVLSSHPDVYMGIAKETEFFNTEYGAGLEFYESFFAGATGERAVGEISNNYYLDPAVAARIRAHIPSARIIVHLRDPYELLASFHGFGIRRGLSLRALSESLDEPIGRLMGTGFERREKEGALTTADRVTLLDAVLLSERFRPFLDAFPGDLVFPFVFHRMKNEPSELVAELFRFLDVDPDFRPPTLGEIVNPTFVPRSRFLAGAARASAAQFRRMRMHRVLARLHRSRTIKRVLFRRPQSRGAAEVRAQLGPRVRRILDEETSRLATLFPVLRAHRA